MAVPSFVGGFQCPVGGERGEAAWPNEHARVAELADAPDLGCDLSQVTALAYSAAWNGKQAKASTKSSVPAPSPVTMFSH
jgi:hypothetical protein